MAFSFEEFKEQVLPYLTVELMDLYRDPSVFDRQRDEVAKTLLGMIK